MFIACPGCSGEGSYGSGCACMPCSMCHGVGQIIEGVPPPVLLVSAKAVFIPVQAPVAKVQVLPRLRIEREELRPTGVFADPKYVRQGRNQVSHARVA